MKTLAQNLRYAARMMLKSPAFTMIAVLTLALGIGANTAIFSVVYSALLRPLPYLDADRLVTMAESRRQLDPDALESSYPDFLDWKRTTRSFQSLAGFSGDAFTITGNGDPKNIFAVQATSNFLSTLGVKPMMGRDFLDGEEQPDGPHVAILSYSFWRSDFGSDPNVIGRTIQLDNKPATIVGVLGPDFEFAPGRSAPIWVPLHPNTDLSTRRNLRWFHVVGRLAPGVTLAKARAEMNSNAAQLARAYPKEDAALIIGMGSLRELIIGKIRPLLLVLFGAVGFVLLIACANVANLLMTRSAGRRKEFAIRAALGASRGNLISQLLTESLLLSSLGAAVGFLAAQWGVNLLLAAIPESQLQSMPYLRQASTNLSVLMFLCGITFLTGVFFGLVPAFSVSRIPVHDALKEESRGGTSAVHSRLRNTFVIAEIAISLVLLVGAGLVLQSLRALLRQNPGYDPHNVLTFNIGLPDTTYPSAKEWPNDNPSAVRFNLQFLDRLGSLPGVQGVAMSGGVPLNSGGSIRFVIEGRPTQLGQEDECDIRGADHRYFQVMKVPLLAGRFYTSSDTEDVPWRAIVNQAFVKKYFPRENPIGKRLRFTYDAREPFREIVGILGNVAEDDLAAPPPAVIYYSADQNPSPFMSYVLRTSGDPAAFVGAARAALGQIDPQLAMVQPQSMEHIADESPSVFLRRYPSFLIATFATLAMLLAMVGLYGLISYTVLQRTREIGIRVALGAQRRDILRLVLREGIGAALAGIAIGIFAGLGLTRLMASLLYGVKPSDGFTFAAVSLLLLLVALAASAIPARRAMRVDPMIALRYE